MGDDEALSSRGRLVESQSQSVPARGPEEVGSSGTAKSSDVEIAGGSEKKVRTMNKPVLSERAEFPPSRSLLNFYVCTAVSSM